MAHKKREGQTKQVHGRCVFCGGTGLTKEHIWSDWLKSVLPSPPRPDHFTHQVRAKKASPTDTPFVWDDSTQKRQGHVNQRKIRNVCRSCNEGWMSAIVQQAKPFAEAMIRGEFVKMNRQDQTNFAAWVAIATIMAEFTDPQSAAIPASEREVLWKTGRPPEEWTIGLGHYGGRGPWHPLAYVHHRADLFIPESPRPLTLASIPPDKMHLQLTTYTLGALAIHAFSATDGRIVPHCRVFPAHKRLRRIWPILHNNVVWPTGRILRDSAMDELANSYYFSAMSGNPIEIDD